MIRLQAARRGRPRWTAADMPDQAGRTAAITGVTGGIGLEVARVLASRGAHLVLACSLASVTGSSRGHSYPECDACIW